MASCHSCDARIPNLDVEVGETVTCEQCGAEHEVLSVMPLELILLDDEELDEEPAREDSESEDDEEEEEEF